MKYSGFYCKVELSEDYIVKKIAEPFGGISKFEAENLLNHIDYYQNKLEQLMIPHPLTISSKVKVFDKNKYIVEFKEKIVGGRTLREILTDNKVSDKQCLKLCQIVLSYFIKVRDDNRRISIDPPLSNFILKDDDLLNPKVYYVDYMPPRQQTMDRWIVEYPGPTNLELQKYHHRRHFTDFQSQVVFVQMCRDRISLRSKLEKLFEKILTKEVLKYVAVPQDKNQMFNLLSSNKVQDIDYLRNIALEAWFQKLISKKDFFAIYDQTHIQEGSGMFPDKINLINVARFLLNRFGK